MADIVVDWVVGRRQAFIFEDAELKVRRGFEVQRGRVGVCNGEVLIRWFDGCLVDDSAEGIGAVELRIRPVCRGWIAGTGNWSALCRHTNGPRSVFRGIGDSG